MMVRRAGRSEGVIEDCVSSAAGILSRRVDGKWIVTRGDFRTVEARIVKELRIKGLSKAAVRHSLRSLERKGELRRIDRSSIELTS